MTHAAESGHWYKSDGTPVWEVAGAKGQMVKPDIRHARKLGLYPGVTTIIRCAATPGLELWKQNQVLLAALTLPRNPGENDESFCKRVIADSGEQARQARDKGTEIHAAIQGHYEGQAPSSEEMWPFVKGVAELLRQNCGMQPWVAERPCAHQLGFGTKADLHSPLYVLDFKGSDFTEAEAPTLKTWDEHAMQLAATRKALSLPSAECGIVYVSRTVPGLCRLVRVDEPELIRGWFMFCGLHAYWCAKSNYDPANWRDRIAA